MGQNMSFKRHQLPVGDEQIPVLVASEEGSPKAVFMSYEGFLELAATLYTAIEALRTAGVDPQVLSSDGPEEAEEFSSWDEGFEDDEDEEDDMSYPKLRLVSGG